MMLRFRVLVREEQQGEMNIQQRDGPALMLRSI